MLKFSGFADLTSCQGIGIAEETASGSEAVSDKATDKAPSGVLLVAGHNRQRALHASRAAESDTLVHKNGQPTLRPQTKFGSPSAA